MSTEMSGTPLFYENTDENIDIMHVDEDIKNSLRELINK